MKILLFGVSNVGKTTIGKLLAEKIKFSFYDLDDEIKKYYGITLEEFVHTENLRWRDQKRGQIINKILKLDENMVLAITPISYPDNFEKCIVADDILLIELCDSPENIFSRLVFSDEEDNLYIDLQYKNEHKEYYMNEIREDIHWYGQIFDKIGVKNKFAMNNGEPEKVVSRLIKEYGLLSQ